MIKDSHNSSFPGRRFLISGALAGAISTLVFTIIHDLFISDIWSMLVVMLPAGALCGAAIGGSYVYLVWQPTWSGWLGYNGLYLGMFAILGVLSELFFEPVMSMAALVAANAPPDDLIIQALPFTAIFTLLMAVAITALYGWDGRRFGVVLLTGTILVLLLGLNISVIGLVSIPRGSLYLVAEMFALVVLLNVVFVVVFVLLERNSLLGRNPGREPTPLRS